LGGAGAGNYTLSQPILTGNISKADQTISFAVLAPATTATSPFNLAATSTSGLTITYSSSNLAVATVTGNVITIVGPGTTIITASQDGNNNYNAATSVARGLTVTAAPALVAGWDFETTANGGTAAATNNAPRVYFANFGSGSLHLDGANGASSWVALPTTGGSNQVTAFSGTALNAASGFSTNEFGPSALALVSATNNSANNQSLVFKFSMVGRKDLTVSYTTRGTPSGFTTQTWFYSTNASDWIQASVQTGRNVTNFSVISLPVITNVNGSADVFLRMTVSGATSSSGNNRIDNVQIVASSLDPLETWTGFYGLSGAQAALGADPDGDGFANLAEYALGGNPTNVTGSFGPAVSTTNTSGTNWMRFTYRARTNDGALVIQPVFKVSLTETNWSTNGVVQKVSGQSAGDGVHEDQEWQTPIGDETRKFLKLNISR